jgi:tRNA modification GTPase
METDTIAAIATPHGTGGISIIKISGPDAIAATEPLFTPRNPQRMLRHLPSQTMLYGHVHESERGEAIDEVLISVLRGPHSFTGEDVVEINCHGGQHVTRSILDEVLRRGVRLAEPGEFTRRAFLNGRIDLTQAEATIDLIQARTKRAARLGSRMLKNGLGNRIKALLRIVADLRMRTEAAIEFDEEAEADLSPQDIQDELEHKILPDIVQMIEGFQHGERVRHGLRVVLAGTPNVGKSSLMNRLLKQERVIVTEVEGTTRDTIDEEVEIGGIPVVLTDTAGLRPSNDPIERIGQEKAQQAIGKADLILMMIDGSRPVAAADQALAKQIAGRPHIVLRNKSDLFAGGCSQAVLNPHPRDGYLDISALLGDGIEELKDVILVHAGMTQPGADEAFLPNRRQKNLLVSIKTMLDNALQTWQTLETLAIDLHDCEHYLNQILGIDVDQDVLDAIFQRFCIGK